MKHFLLLLAMLGMINASKAQSTSYCSAGATNDYEYIASVQCGMIQNNTSNSAGDHYRYYSDLSTQMTVGNSYPIVVINGLPYLYDECGVWIDWNHDMDFDDQGEQQIMSVIPGYGPYSGSIIPPADAVIGITRMRVRICDGSDNVLSPCGMNTWGEIEDYNIIVNNPLQVVNISIPDTVVCAGQITVPVLTSGIGGVTTFQLKLDLYPGFNFLGLTNINPVISNNLICIPGTSSVLFFWTSPYQISFQTDTLFSILADAIPGNYNLNWDLSNGQSYFNASTYGNIPIQINYSNILVTACGQISGNITYYNSQQSAITNETYVLLMETVSGLLMINYPDSSGYYNYSGILNGTYDLSIQTNTPWGGGNATDGLAILKHFVGMSVLSGLRLQAADVNADGNVNSMDALLVMKRFVGIISSFPAGDWVFEQQTITVSGATPVVANVKGLCVGDVNGSYFP